MRVLMLTQFYPPVVGGQERHVRNLAQELSKRHEVEVATIALEGDAGTTLDERVPVHRLSTSTQRLPWLYSDMSRTHAPPTADPELRRAIARLLGGGRFDVVHAHDWIVNSALGPAHRARTPVVLTQHDYSQVCATKLMTRNGAVCPGPGPSICVRCAARHYGTVLGPGVAAVNLVESRRRRAGVAAFVAVSSVVASRTGLLGHPKSEVIPNFIPDDLVLEHPPANFDGPLLYAGDLTVNKGVAVLLEAYQRLDRPPPLLLAGRVPNEPWLKAPEGAELLGVVPYDEVISLMRAARIVIVPSITLDPCPTVVLEAMASGRPVVAAASGGIVDLVADGVTGALVPAGDPVPLAGALTEMLADPARAVEMGRNGLSRVRMFTASAVVGRIEDVYRRVSAKSRAG